jgi:3-oxoacyl-[acyl-carrier protein] reductase
MSASQQWSLARVAIGDLAAPSVAPAAVEAAIHHFGRLNVLISNAEIADRTPFAGLSNEALVRSAEAIQGAFFRLAVAALPHFRSAGGGRVVAVSRFVAHALRPGLPTFPLGGWDCPRKSPRSLLSWRQQQRLT